MPTRSGKKYKLICQYTPRKQPLNSFMLWFHGEGLSYIRLQYPSLNLNDITSFAGKFWRKMPDEDKVKWRQKALKLKSE